MKHLFKQSGYLAASAAALAVALHLASAFLGQPSASVRMISSSVEQTFSVPKHLAATAK